MVMPLLRFKRDEGSNYPEWKEDTLKGLGTFIRGLSYSSNLETDDTSKTLVLRANNIISDGFVDLKNNVKYVDKIPKNEQILLKGDIAIATTSSPGIVGKTALYNSVYEGNITVGAFCCIYRSCNPIMPYVLRSPRYKYLSNISMADSVGGFRNLYISNLEAMTFFVPSSLEEQQKIADFLSDIDNQIENYQQSLDNLESQKKELLQQVFSQELRFKRDDGSEYPDWTNDKFKNVFTSLSYGMSAAAKPFDGENKYIRITDIDDYSHKYKSQDIVSPNAELKDKYLVKNRDILFARTGATVGKTYIYDINDGTIYYAGYLIRGNVKTEYVPMFIFYVTLTDEYRKWVNRVSKGKTAQPGINSKQYESYEFLCPCFEEQQKIADFFSDIDNRIELERQRLQTMQELKKGLLQQMFC